MEPHPHPDARALWPRLLLDGALASDRGGEGFPGVREHNEERVALRSDDGSAVSPKRVSEQSLVGLEHARIALPERLQESRAALDVAEQERDRSRR